MCDEINILKNEVKALQQEIINSQQSVKRVFREISHFEKTNKLYEIYKQDPEFQNLMAFISDKKASQSLMDYIHFTPNIKGELETLLKIPMLNLTLIEMQDQKYRVESTKNEFNEISINLIKQIKKSAELVNIELRASSDNIKSELIETFKQHKAALEKLTIQKMSLKNNQKRSKRHPKSPALQQIIDLKVSVYPPELSSKYIKKLLSQLGDVKLTLVEIELEKIGYTKYKHCPLNGPEEFRYECSFTSPKNKYEAIKNETWIVYRVPGSFRNEGIYKSDMSMKMTLEYAGKLNLKYSATPKQVVDVLSYLKYRTYPKNITAKELDALKIPVSQKELTKIGYVEYARNCETKQVTYCHHEFIRSIKSGISVPFNGH